MPTTIQDIEEQRKRVTASQEEASRVAGTPSSFEASLRNELGKRQLDKGVDKLSQKASTARQDFVKQPTALNTEYAAKGIDPYHRMNEVANRRGQLLGEIKSISDLQSQQNSGIDQLIQGIRLGMEAEAQRAAQKPVYEQQTYQNLLNELLNQQAQEQQSFENAFTEKEFGLEEKYKNAQIQDLLSTIANRGKSSTADSDWETFLNTLIQDNSQPISWDEAGLSGVTSGSPLSGNYSGESGFDINYNPPQQELSLTPQKAAVASLIFPSKSSGINNAYDYLNPKKVEDPMEKKIDEAIDDVWKNYFAITGNDGELSRETVKQMLVTRGIDLENPRVKSLLSFFE
jgi:hypothetical protein